MAPLPRECLCVHVYLEQQYCFACLPSFPCIHTVHVSVSLCTYTNCQHFIGSLHVVYFVDTDVIEFLTLCHQHMYPTPFDLQQPPLTCTCTCKCKCVSHLRHTCIEKCAFVRVYTHTHVIHASLWTICEINMCIRTSNFGSRVYVC